MNQEIRRVVVTGLGVVSPVGSDMETAWNHLISGYNGIGPITYFDTTNYKAKLNNVKFRSSVKPGDTVETRCHIKRAKHPFYFAEGTVMVGDRLCVSAEFSFAITGA